MAIAEKHWGDPHAACQEIVAAAYNYWATEDTRSDDVTCMAGGGKSRDRLRYILWIVRGWLCRVGALLGRRVGCIQLYTLF